jgi:twitching motility two-component system response regulator PilH
MLDPLKIMIVDDDKTTLEVLSAVLERAGHEVITRETSIGTTLAIMRESPDVVLLDVRMPGLSGDKLAGLIANRNAASSPIVVLHSSSTRSELQELASRCGAAGIIEKTGDSSEFMRTLERVLSGELRRRAASGAKTKSE